MAELTQFLNAGGKPLKTVDIGFTTLSSTIGASFTITPAADQRVAVSIAVDAGTTTDRTITIGGTTVYTGLVSIFGSVPSGNIINHCIATRNFQFVGGKGEAVVFSNDGAQDSGLYIVYQLLEEV